MLWFGCKRGVGAGRIEPQVREVQIVKRTQHGIINDPYTIDPAATLAEARQSLAGLDFDYALLDVNLPDGRSLRLLEEKVVPANVVTVVMTAEGGVAGAVEAMRLGAADYLVKEEIASPVLPKTMWTGPMFHRPVQ